MRVGFHTRTIAILKYKTIFARPRHHRKEKGTLTGDVTMNFPQQSLPF